MLKIISPHAVTVIVIQPTLCCTFADH